MRDRFHSALIYHGLNIIDHHMTTTAKEIFVVRRMKRVVGAVVLLSAALLVPHSVDARDAVPAAHAFDVAGVRLGMTPAEAALAITAYDPRFHLQKQYFCGNLRDDECFRRTSSVPIAAIVGATDPILNGQSGYAEKLVVGFSSIPSRERVVSVRLERNYSGVNAPSEGSVETLMSSKFPAHAIKKTDPVFTLGAFLDPEGRSIDRDADDPTDLGYSMQRALSEVTVPPQARYRGAVAFVGRVGAINGIAVTATLCLYDENALYETAKERERFNAANLAAKAAAAPNASASSKF